MQTVLAHSGNFHPDDVFAVATLQLHLGTENVVIKRSRLQSEIDAADWVVDVGEVYDPSRQRFDHHQIGGPVRENGIPYAAFGLVWKEVGEQLCSSQSVADVIEKTLVIPIDAGDNGIKLYEVKEDDKAPAEVYHVIDSFRPVWGSDDDEDKCFERAVDFARELIARQIRKFQGGERMMRTVEARYQAAEDKSIIVFDESIKRNALVGYPDVNIMVYFSDSGGDERWKAETITKTHNTFETRVQFPEAWGGLRGEDLERVSGIAGAMFCHKELWLFVAKTKEGVMQAAQIANQNPVG